VLITSFSQVGQNNLVSDSLAHCCCEVLLFSKRFSKNNYTQYEMAKKGKKGGGNSEKKSKKSKKSSSSSYSGPTTEQTSALLTFLKYAPVKAFFLLSFFPPPL
jgi:hypothetical protein